MDETNQNQVVGSIEEKLKLAGELIDYSEYMDGRKNIQSHSDGSKSGYNLSTFSDYVGGIQASILQGKPEPQSMYQKGVNEEIINVLSSHFLEQKPTELVPAHVIGNHLSTMFQIYVVSGKALDEGLQVADKLLDNPMLMGKDDEGNFNQSIYSNGLRVVSSFLDLVNKQGENIGKVAKYVPSQKVVETYEKVNAKS